MTAFHLIRAVAICVALGVTILQTGCSFSSAASMPAVSTAKQFWVYIGNNSTEGIGLYKLDVGKGTLVSAGIAAPANKPGFFAFSPDEKFLFAGVATGGAEGAIESFSVNAATGKLTAINSQSSKGEEPCFVAVDPAGKNVLTTNYNAATVAVLPFDGMGKLSPATTVIKQTGSSVDPQRQTHAYAHSINPDPAGKYAITCDLGADKLFIYKLDSAKGTLTANDPASVSTPAGSGPRHLTFSPDGKFAYVLTEMGGKVLVYSYDAAKGALHEVQVISALKNNEAGNGSAEVQIDPTGRFLYASNRLTTNYLTIFTRDQATGKLTVKGFQDALGKTPRNYRIDPTGQFMVVVNQGTNSMVLFKINHETGELMAAGEPIATMKEPICVKFLAVAGS